MNYFKFAKEVVMPSFIFSSIKDKNGEPCLVIVPTMQCKQLSIKEVSCLMRVLEYWLASQKKN